MYINNYLIQYIPTPPAQINTSMTTTTGTTILTARLSLKKEKKTNTNLHANIIDIL